MPTATTHTVTVTSQHLAACGFDPICFADHHQWIGSAIGSAITAAATFGIAFLGFWHQRRTKLRTIVTSATQLNVLISSARVACQVCSENRDLKTPSPAFDTSPANGSLAGALQRISDSLAGLALPDDTFLPLIRNEAKDRCRELANKLSQPIEARRHPATVKQLAQAAASFEREEEHVMAVLKGERRRAQWIRLPAWLTKRNRSAAAHP